MNIKTLFFKNLIFVFTLLSCIACKKDAHDFFYFVNHSDVPVWIHADSYSDDDSKDFKPIPPFDHYIEAHDTLEIAPSYGLDWEGILYKGMRLVVCVYDQSLSARPESESYEEFKHKHLLQENWYTLDEINAMDWKIHYYPNVENDASD